MKNSYLFFLIIILFSISPTFGQSLTGMSGLLSIPTSELNDDRTIVVGSNYLSKRYLDYTKESYNAFNIYATINFLPFLELGGRVTRVLDLPKGSIHNVDRMFSLRLKALEQGEYLPSIAIGADNPVSTEEKANHFNSLYAVATKTISFNTLLNNIELTIGYGSDMIEAADHEFIGVFGGVSVRIFNYLQLITEYDAKHVNGGAKLFILNRIQLLACWKSFRYFSGGASFKVQL